MNLNAGRHAKTLSILCGALALAGCASDPLEPPGRTEPLGRAADLYELPPFYQSATYRHMDANYPTRTVQRGESVYELPRGEPLEVRYRAEERTLDTADFMRRNDVHGLLVIDDGEIVLERYADDTDATSRWTSFSVVKSISSTLIGAAVQQGLIESLDDPVTDYLPSLAGSGYEGVTLKQILQMSSGVRWNEDYQDPESDRRLMFDRQLDEQVGGILELMGTLPREAEPGTRFHYSTGESHLQSEVLTAATGRTVSDYLSERIWSRMGMERDAFWQLESRAGQEIGSSGFSATLRDYGRFGQFLLNDGVIDGERVLPAGWIEAATSVDPSTHIAPGKLYGGEYPIGYGYQWWTFPVGDASLDHHDGGAYEGEGIFGQFLYVNPGKRIVAVVWSAWPEPWIDEREFETYDFLGAAIAGIEKRRSS